MLAAVAALAGCTVSPAPGAPKQVAPLAVAGGVPLVVSAARMQSVHQSPRSERAAGLRPMPAYVYVCEYFESVCNIYTTAGTLLQSVTSGLELPQGAVADKKGNWFVANTNASNVLVFGAGSGSLAATLSDDGQQPVSVDVSLVHRTVAVSNITGSAGNGSLSVFLSGSLTPSVVLTVKGNAEGIGVAIDSAGNCFWSYDDTSSGGSAIVEYKGCKGKAKVVSTSTGSAGGIAFDGQDNLFTIDGDTGDIDRCKGLKQCVDIAPGVGAMLMTFDKNWRHIWATTEGGVDEIDPHTGAVEATFQPVGGSSDVALGIAAGPGPK